MIIGPDTELLQPVLKQNRRFLIGELRNDNAAHIESPVPELADQTQDVGVISDSQISAYFISLNVFCGNGDDDLRAVSQLYQHLQLRIRTKTGQDPGSMIIIEELASEFQIQFSSEMFNSLLDMFRLCPEILFRAESCFHMLSPLS